MARKAKAKPKKKSAKKPREPKVPVLTAQQKVFVQRYVEHANGSRAAREADYKSRNSAYELLNLPEYKHVQDYIQALTADHLAMLKRELPNSIRTLVRSRDFDPGCLRRKPAEINGTAAYGGETEAKVDGKPVLVAIVDEPCPKDEAEAPDSEWVPWEELDPEDRQCITEFSQKFFEGGSSVRYKWKNGDLAAAKLIQWALKHSDNTPKESESQIKATLKARMAAMVESLFPDEQNAPDAAPEKAANTAEEGPGRPEEG